MIIDNNQLSSSEELAVRQDTGLDVTNTSVFVYTNIVPGDKIKITVILKDFGSEKNLNILEKYPSFKKFKRRYCFSG